MATAPKHFQPALLVVVADVDQRDEERADERQRAGDEEALVDRLQRVGLALLGLDEEDADDRRDHADGASGEREDEAERRVGADGVERGDTEDDRGDERDFVALEQVGGHAGAVADVVADVVGDGGRVARVVFGDAGLDLADEVGADVGGLGEDAAADAQEQGEQRTTETEADEDDRRRVLEQHDDQRRAEQAEADREHAGDAAGAEGDGRAPSACDSVSAAAAVRTLPRVASVMPMKPVSTRCETAEDERQRCATDLPARS